jgi:adenylate cyclase
VTDVREFLRKLGVPRAEIEKAEAQGPQALQLLALDRTLLPGENRYTQEQVAEKAGVPLEVARRFWVAMGFVEPAPDEAAFTDADIEALGLVKELLAREITNPLLATQQTRVMGLSLARVAESAVSAWRDRRIMPLRSEEDYEGLDVDEDMVQSTQALLGANERFLIYIWRRHLAAAAKRNAVSNLEGPDERPTQAVGFADLVGFTKISQNLEEQELAEMVELFEVSSHEAISSMGGRLVKMIGDEVMFVADEPATAVDIGLALSERHTEDEVLPDLRVGLAWGPVLAREGDFYGPVVNLANRITRVARPGTVLVSDALQGELAESDGVAFRRVPTPPLKDIGRVRLWRVRRADGEGGQDRVIIAEDARETAADFTEGTLAKVSEVAEDALARAALAVDEVIEKASVSATGKVLRHRERKDKKAKKRERPSGENEKPTKRAGERNR